MQHNQELLGNGLTQQEEEELIRLLLKIDKRNMGSQVTVAIEECKAANLAVLAEAYHDDGC